MAGSLSFGFTVGTAPVSTALYTIFGARKRKDGRHSATNTKSQDY